MNWVNASDYIDAAQKYVAGYSEDRPVVVNGRRTGQTKHVAVNGIVTWTPGDVTAAEKKGGLVSIVSTKEYSSQMPCVVIGIDKWMQDNSETVRHMIEAIAEGSQAIRSNPDALHKAAQISNMVYKESGTDPAYWEKYYRGMKQKDATGVVVDLGGSKANTMADTMYAFGLMPGSADLVSATYTVFGNLVHSQYPELLPSVAPASDVIDKSYVQVAARELAPAPAQIAQAKTVYHEVSQQKNNLVGHRAWNIHFNSGKATFSPDAKKLLDQLSSDLLVASGTVVEIHGYTDNQGNPATSMPLSQARAAAVKNYLETTHPVNFPRGRVKAFAHGEANPVADNGTSEGRARNRRVEIILRSAT
jgi:OOP family OmpA-OmpF porin